MNLAGCTPEPLLSYLKALGIFRLAHLCDPDVRAAWKGDQFRLWTRVSREALVDYLLDEYCPAPIIAPWNGGSGFWDRTAAGQALSAVAESSTPRLAAFRTAISATRAVIARSGWEEAPEREAKERFLRTLRNELPDAALDWLDAAVVLTENAARYAALLGTGGNDGRLDFTANFMQRLSEILPLDGQWTPEGKRAKGRASPQRSVSRAWLLHALFAEGRPAMLSAALGQFHPGGVGGANSTQGFEGSSLVNPWEFVLMLEGSLLLAGAAARRFGATGWAKAAFPFTVDAAVGGWGTLVQSDAGSARAELWLPLWHSPATCPEVCHLLGEGRAQVGGRQARSGLEFARAVSGLGVDRGIQSFVRYGFLLRNGLAYLASPLGRVQVREQPAVRLLDELDGWISALRMATESGSDRYRTALRQMDRNLFAAAIEASPGRLQSVMMALGAVEEAVSLSPKLQERIPPLAHLSPHWLEAADDQSTEWRLAVALGSIGAGQSPIRLHWEPLRAEKGRLIWAAPGDREVFLTDLVSVLVNTLERRLLDAETETNILRPLAAAVPANPHDIASFIRGQTDDQRILALAATVATVKWGERGGLKPSSPPAAASVPATFPRGYALLKLLFHDGQHQGDRRILTLLHAGQFEPACALATHRIRVAGRSPLGRVPGRGPGFIVSEQETRRLAAALLFPVTDQALAKFAGLVLQPAAAES